MNPDLLKFVQDPELSCMSIRQLAVLISVKGEPKNNSAIAIHLKISKSSVSKAVQRLFQLKLINYIMVKDERVSDQRKRYIELSNKARVLLLNENV